MIGEVIIGKGKNTFKVGESTIFQFILYNNTNTDIVVSKVEEGLPFGFKFKASNDVALVDDNFILEPQKQRIKSGDNITFFIEAVAEKPVFNLKYIPKVVWKESESSEVEKTQLLTYRYSIFEKISTATQQLELTEMKKIIRKKNILVSRYIRNLGITSTALRKTLEQVLPVNFSFTAYPSTHTNNESFMEKTHDSSVSASVESLVDYFNERKEFTLTFITGPKLIGKTTFAATLLYKLWLSTANTTNSEASQTIGKYVISLSLKGEKRRIDEIVNESIANNETLEDCNTLEDALDLCEDENKILELWIDADYYKRENSFSHIASWISKIVRKFSASKYLRVFVVWRDSLLTNLLDKYKDLVCNIITFIPLNKESAIKIAVDALNLSEKSEDDKASVKKILENIILRKDRLNLFTKAPYLYHLIETVKDFQEGILKLGIDDEFLAEKLIIATIDRLHQEIVEHPDITPFYFAQDIRKKLNIEESKVQDPEFFRVADIRAIDFETEFILPRPVEISIRAKLNNSNTKIIFIGGKSGTGKTVIALKLGYELWKQGYSVIYLNAGDVSSNVDRFLGVLHNSRNDIVVLLDDAHLDIDRRVMCAIYNIAPVKILATERCSPEESILGSILEQYDKMIRASGEKLEPLRAIGDLIKQNETIEFILSKPDFNSFVRRLVKFLRTKENIVSFNSKNNYDSLVETLVKKTEETIILLRFVIRHYIKNKKTKTFGIESLESLEIKDVIKDYISSIALKFQTEISRDTNLGLPISVIPIAVNRIFAYTAVFSQYEIFISDDFITDGASRLQFDDALSKYYIKNHAIAKKLMITLLNKFIITRELIKKTFAERITNQNDEEIIYQYALPHTTLAKYIFDYFFNFDEVKAKNIQKQELIKYHLLGHGSIFETIKKLEAYNKKLLKEAITDITNDKHLKMLFEHRLKKLSLMEITSFIPSFPFMFGHLDVGKIIFDNFKDTFLSKGELFHLDSISLNEITEFLERLYLFYEAEAKLVLKRYYKNIVNKNIYSASVSDIIRFLEVLIQFNDAVAKLFVESHYDDLLQRDYSSYSIKELRIYLSLLVKCSNKLAKKIVELNYSAILKKSVAFTQLSEVGEFLYILSLIDKNIAKEFFKIHQEDIFSKFSSASLSDISVFLSNLSTVDIELARETIKMNYANLVERNLRELSVETISTFLHSVAIVDQNIAKKIVNTKYEEIMERDFLSEDLGAIGHFLGAVALVDKNLADKWFLSHSDFISNELIIADIGSVGIFIEFISEYNPTMAEMVVEHYKEIIVQKDPRSSDMVGVNILLRSLGALHKYELFKELILNYREEIKNVDFEEDTFYDFMGILVGTDETLAKEVIKRHLQFLQMEINSILSKLIFGDIASERKQLLRAFFLIQIIAITSKELAEKILVENKDNIDSLMPHLSVKTLTDVLTLLNMDSILCQKFVNLFDTSLKRRFTEMTIDELADFICYLSCLDREDASTKIPLDSLHMIMRRGESDVKLTLYLIERYSSVIRKIITQSGSTNIKNFYEKLSESDARVMRMVKSIVNN